ncbi:hypothetical protein JCM3766R1_004657 [Sporobolomyces carnicolor]
MPPIDKEAVCHVHLTGFGPFHNVPINPSWEAVQRLNGATLEAPVDDQSATPKTIRIKSHLVPVKYSAVLSQIPALHSAGGSDGRTPPPDVLVHVGVGTEGKVRLEQRARKWGYDKLDVDGHLGPFDESENKRGFAGDEWIELDDELATTVDVARVVGDAKRRGLEHVETSHDAGLYLCEFTYYASLASAQKLNSGRPTLVQFVHVPPIGKPYSLDQLTEALKVLVLSIAETARAT